VHPLAIKLTGTKAPPDGMQSKWSIYHSAAVALVDGAAGERQYSDERVHDPAVAGLRGRVTADVDPGLREDEAQVAITLRERQGAEAACRSTQSAAPPVR
jgi:2-methylcitrate dehydratase PrpD